MPGTPRQPEMPDFDPHNRDIPDWRPPSIDAPLSRGDATRHDSHTVDPTSDVPLFSRALGHRAEHRLGTHVVRSAAQEPDSSHSESPLPDDEPPPVANPESPPIFYKLTADTRPDPHPPADADMAASPPAEKPHTEQPSASSVSIELELRPYDPTAPKHRIRYDGDTLDIDPTIGHTEDFIQTLRQEVIDNPGNAGRMNDPEYRQLATDGLIEALRHPPQDWDSSVLGKTDGMPRASDQSPGPQTPPPTPRPPEQN